MATCIAQNGPGITITITIIVVIIGIIIIVDGTRLWSDGHNGIQRVSWPSNAQ